MKIFVPLLAGFSLTAAPFLPLPDPIAWVDGKSIPASKISAVWKNTLASLPDDVSQETVQRFFTSLATQAIWQREIAAMLASSGIPVARETACRYFEDQFKQYPSYFSPQIKKEYLATVDTPDIMLKAALHYYLKKNSPEKITVSQDEVESYYRTQQEEFKRPANIQLGSIKTKTREEAEMARAYLLQGGDFYSAHRRFSIKEKNIQLPQNLQPEKMKIKEVTPVIPVDNGFLVMQVIKKTQAAFRPLEQVYPQIILLLSSQKEGQILTTLLTNRLKSKKIIFAPLRFDK